METSRKDIKRMMRLMRRLESKKFDTDDLKELKNLSAGFLYFAAAIEYTDGYSLKD